MPFLMGLVTSLSWSIACLKQIRCSKESGNKVSPGFFIRPIYKNYKVKHLLLLHLVSWSSQWVGRRYF